MKDSAPSVSGAVALTADQLAGLIAELREQLRMPPPVLLTDEQGAARWGVSLRRFMELQHEPFFPAPVMLGPRQKRHSVALLDQAIANMPRADELRPEPTNLLRARVERLKAGACRAAG